MRNALQTLLQRLKLATRVLDVRPLKPDAGGTKVSGYGEPVRILAEDERGLQKTFVLHTASPNVFGHDRRADRVDELVLSYDTYPLIPGHVAPLDVGFLVDGGFSSAGSVGEPYLLTSWAEGRPYVEDLRNTAAHGAGARDLQRCRTLAGWLAALHANKLDAGHVYRRAVRDLLGHGEGIFGVVDSYPADTPAAPPARLRAIEQQCVEWRWRLRAGERRLSRIHGDFHPFNILFDDGPEPCFVDASRGCAGDPADDVAALVINYLFFATDVPASWPAFSQLWDAFWLEYLADSRDEGVLEVIAPFLAWRGLVVCDPCFYPGLSAAGRDLILGFVERVLAAPRLDLSWADESFR